MKTEARHRICGAGFFLSAAITAAQCLCFAGERKKHRVMGIAALHPSYAAASSLRRDGVGWVEHLRNPSRRRFAFDYNFEPTRGAAIMGGLL